MFRAILVLSHIGLWGGIELQTGTPSHFNFLIITIGSVNRENLYWTKRTNGVLDTRDYWSFGRPSSGILNNIISEIVSISVLG